MCNITGKMHSGALATVIDFSTSVAIMAFDKRNRVNVSTELSISLLNSVNAGEDILILSQIDRIGRTMAFSHATIFDEKYNELAFGKHLKTFLDVKYNLSPGAYSHPKKHVRSTRINESDPEL